MGFFAADSSVLSLFGKLRFNQLKGLLDTCCSDGSLNLPCCPSQKYTISLSLNHCLSPNAFYDVTVTPNTALFGSLVFTIIGSEQGDGGGVFGIVGGVDKDAPGVISNVPFAKNTTMTVFLVDSRGNWSNAVTFKTVNC